MKKRFVTTLLSLIACIACIIGFAACGGADPVDGKTYEFENVEITSDLEGTLKEQTEAQLKTMLGECYIEFGTDGTFERNFMGETATGTYKQSGSTLTLTVEGDDEDVKVSGDTIVMEYEVEGWGLKVTFKAVAEPEADAE